MKNEKAFVHTTVLRNGKIQSVYMDCETLISHMDWDYTYCDALLSAEMKRQKEINRLLDEIQRLRNLVFTLEE